MIKLSYREFTKTAYFTKDKKTVPIEFKFLKTLGTEIRLGIKDAGKVEKDMGLKDVNNASTMSFITGYVNFFSLALAYFMGIIYVLSGFSMSGLIKDILIALAVWFFSKNMNINYSDGIVKEANGDGWMVKQERIQKDNEVVIGTNKA